MITDFKKFENIDKEKEFETKFEKIKKFLPGAYIVGDNIYNKEIVCDAHKYSELGDDKAYFASNAFESLNELKELIKDLEEVGAQKIEVGRIDVEEYNDDGKVAVVWADTLYFKNVRRNIIIEDEIEFPQQPIFSWKYYPSELDCWEDEKEEKIWYGIDPYGEEGWDDDIPHNTWYAWWD